MHTTLIGNFGDLRSPDRQSEIANSAFGAAGFARLRYAKVAVELISSK